MKLPSFSIGNLTFDKPIVQGGMGIGISLSKLASAVSMEGGLGVISAAQIGFKEPDFYKNNLEANLRAFKEEITKAKDMAKGGIIGANVMVVTKGYADYIKTAIESGIDAIISGAGLPMDLPKIAGDSDVKLIPIVSSMRAAKLIAKTWMKKYDRQPDAFIIEGPKAGGHLGFAMDDLQASMKDLSEIITNVKEYLQKESLNIPIIAGGGIFDGKDVKAALDAGADAVQIGTRFVTTFECDASDAFKEAYVEASEDDVKLLMSPVGLPGRAIVNDFLDEYLATGKLKVTNCYRCMDKCNPSITPFCITDRLIKAVNGDIDQGLVFAGDNAWRCNKLESVHEVFESINNEYDQQ